MPVLPHIYGPVLDELATLGIAFRETTETLPATADCGGDRHAPGVR
jgi:hypothetical protein